MPYHKTTMHNLLSSMLSKGIIQPSKNPWASPVVLIKKKDGIMRFCLDYRMVNAVNFFPLCCIDNKLDTLSILDMTSGYWLVEILKRTDKRLLSLLMKGYIFKSESNAIWPLQCACHITEADNMVLEGICTMVQMLGVLVYDLIKVGKLLKNIWKTLI